MKKAIRYLAFATCTTLLVACGGGGSSVDVADQFVGGWRFKCFAWTNDAGRTLYSTGTISFAKTSPSSLTANEVIEADYADSACTQLVESGPWTNLATVNIGEEAVFLGLMTRRMTWAKHSNGEVLPGYFGVSGSQLYLRTYTPGTTPNGWGRAYPANRI